MEKFSGTSEMTGNQMLVFEVEAYLEENFEFRRNVVSGKTEYRAINCEEWTILTEEALNSIVREAKKHGIGDDKSPRQDINEYVMSNAVKRYSPVCDFLDTLPKWDGQNHIAGLFNRIPDGFFIDNVTPLDYGQLYAQALYEIRETEAPYWFNANEVERIQQANAAYFRTDDLETMLSACVRVPSMDEEDGEWMRMNDICDKITKQYPTVMVTTSLKVKIGQTLKVLGCSTKHTNKGQCYRIVPLCA